MVAYMFPGQGSQQKGMGHDLFPHFPDLMTKANTILGYSLETLCLEDPHQQLGQTHYTQPAIYTVNALSYFKKLQENSQKPTYVMGHSLGEYNALLSADVFDFETGLRLVQKRGELMSQANGGAMAAIIGLKEELIKTLLIQHNLTTVTIANYNTYNQLILSGPKADVDRAQEICDQAGATLVVPLKVSAAFHSPSMKSAQEQFESFLKEFHFASSTLPVIANSTARPYPAEDALIKKTLAQQITSPVYWTKSVEYILDQGDAEFVEVGFGKVLTDIIRYIKNGQ